MRNRWLCYALWGSCILAGCHTPKTVTAKDAPKENPYLKQWVMTDSLSPAPSSTPTAPDAPSDKSLQELRNRVNTETYDPYFGESIRYMLESLFGK